MTQKRPASEFTRFSRVLVVDDHADTSRVLRRLLTTMGHEVQCAGTVAEAVELARIQSFDLLISDISLPDGTGIDLLHRIQEIQPIRALAMSGHALDEDKRRSLLAGFSTHLIKPVSIDQLTAAMAEAMREQPGPAPVATQS